MAEGNSLGIGELVLVAEEMPEAAVDIAVVVVGAKIKELKAGAVTISTVELEVEEVLLIVAKTAIRHCAGVAFLAEHQKSCVRSTRAFSQINCPTSCRN